MIKSLILRGCKFLGAFIKDPLAHWPFAPLSRQLFGNTAGAKQNLYGGSQIAYYRLFGQRNGLSVSDTWSDGHVRKLKRDGVLKIESGIFPSETIQLIQRKFEEKGKASRRFSEYMISFGGKEIVSDIPEVFDIFKSNQLQKIMQGYFNGAFQIDDINYRRTFHVPNSVREKGEIYSDYWHCDSSPISELALFINLIDIDNECGPTMVIDKNHSRALVRKYYRARRSQATIDAIDAAIDQRQCAQAFTGPAGSILIAQSTKCLHRASIPGEGKMRDWLSFRLFPAHAPAITDRIVRNGIWRYTHGTVQ